MRCYKRKIEGDACRVKILPLYEAHNWDGSRGIACFMDTKIRIENEKEMKNKQREITILNVPNRKTGE